MNRLREQRGFTLPEVMTAMFIALIVSLAAFALIEFTIRRAGEVTGRVEATQKGRLAMDTITQHMRSQVCLSSTVPPLDIAGANVASFYADLTDGNAGLPPQKHTMRYDPVTRKIMESDFAGTRAANTITYSALPSRERQLAENVVPGTAGAPIFRYFAYDTATPPRPVTELLPTAVAPDGTPTLNATDRARTVRVEISFRALPPGIKGNAATGDILLSDDVYVRAADPDDPRDVRPPDPLEPIPPICS